MKPRRNYSSVVTKKLLEINRTSLLQSTASKLEKPMRINREYENRSNYKIHILSYN